MQQRNLGLLVLGHGFPGTTAAAWGNQAFEQRDPWGLLAGMGYQEYGSCCRHRGSKPVDRGSSGACLPDAGVQEPQELLQSQNNAWGQCEPWGLLASAGFWEHSTAAAAGMENQAC
jgi:hypothetical protein